MNNECIPIVVKIGGSIMHDAQYLDDFFMQWHDHKAIRPVIVHGGGNQVAQLLRELGKNSEKKNGLRVTPDGDMPYVAGVLAGSVNKLMVSHAIKCGLSAVGLSAADGGLIEAVRFDSELGAVGKPKDAKVDLLCDLFKHHWIPLVSSIALDTDSRLVNINADHVAAVLAEALGCELILLSDVDAVLDENKQRIPTISSEDIKSYITNGVITDGMLVKVDSALQTAKKTNKSVTIASWKASIASILQGECGTRIKHS